MLGYSWHLPADAQVLAETRAQIAVPSLQAAFPSLSRFLPMAGWQANCYCMFHCCIFHCPWLFE